MIDLNVNEEKLEKVVERARERDIVIPTFEQQKHPELIPDQIKEKLKNTGLWDIDSTNLFRITWKNEPQKEGGLFDGVNYLELPHELTGVDARIIALVGKWFPTGAHKVGATFGCLVPRLITGQFDPTTEKAVWPSTGNYCRGGAYDADLLACDSIAILPEGMSQERFDWLQKVAGEVISTPGTESNVKEIFDKCWELRQNRDDIHIFNQFDEFGNHLWHYQVTGPAIEEVARQEMSQKDRLAGLALTSGSSGTLGCADYIKEAFPGARLAVGEALQCPTLLNNGYGAHRIEGIGDKHVPWIHNVRNTDMVIAVDDNDSMNLVRLFNTDVGHKYLKDQGVPASFISKLSLLGISSIANMLASIKMARYYEMDQNDIIFTIFTDSMELYNSRLQEMKAEAGNYGQTEAAVDFHRNLRAVTTDNMEELTYKKRRRIHNLKYYTWIEQQDKELEELNAQWYDYPDYWDKVHNKAEEIDELIKEFNERTGLLEN